MRRKMIMLLVCAVIAGRTVPISAAPTDEQEDTVVTSSISRADLGTQNNVVESAAQSVVLVHAFVFDDRSIEIWSTSSALAVDENTLVAPAEAADFERSQEAYEKLAKSRKTQYGRLGIDLDDYEAVSDSFVLYALQQDGEVIECGDASTDEALGITKLKTVSPMDVDSAEFAEKYETNMLLAGFDTDATLTASDIVTGGDSQDLNVSVIEIGASDIDNGTLTAQENLDLNFAGAALYADDGSVCGMVTSVTTNTAALASASQIKSLIENTSGGATETEDQDIAEELGKLEIAVTRAKNIDTSGYTEKSVSAFEEAITDAEEVLSDVGATLEDVEKAGTALNTAKEDLTQSDEEVDNASVSTSSGTETPKQENGDSQASSAYMRYIGLGAIAGVIVVLLLFVSKIGKKTPKKESRKEKKADPDGQTTLMKLLGVKPKAENQRLKAEKERQKANRAKAKEEGYKGEIARKQEPKAVFPQDEEDDEKTTVLKSDGEDETTVLKSKLPRAYLVDKNGTEILINKEKFVLGKQKKMVDYCITDNSTISRKHCQITLTTDGCSVEDLKSLNGTQINQFTLEPHTVKELADGDILTLSDEPFTFHID